MRGRIAVFVGLVLSGLIVVPAAAAPLPDAFVALSFLTDPIPADGLSSSTLRVGVVRLDGAIADGTHVTLERDPASAAVCSLAGLGTAEAVVINGHADVSVMSADQPGQCRIVATANDAQSGEAVLTTRPGGTATRLTVSGNDSPRTVGESVLLSVDVDDIYVALVPGDHSTVVSAAVDPDSCSGRPAGPVSVAPMNGGMVIDGRAWFSARSFGAYRACRVTFTVPGLRTAVATVSFASGPADHLSCEFAKGAFDRSVTASAEVELRDAYENRATSLAPYVVSFASTLGNSSVLVSAPERSMSMGVAFFFVRGGSTPGIDDYTASIAASSPSSLPAPAAHCSVEVRSPAP